MDLTANPFYLIEDNHYKDHVDKMVFGGLNLGSCPIVFKLHDSLGFQADWHSHSTEVMHAIVALLVGLTPLEGSSLKEVGSSQEF